MERCCQCWNPPWSHCRDDSFIDSGLQIQMLLADSWMAIFGIFYIAFLLQLYLFDGNCQNLQFTIGLHIYGFDHMEFWSGWDDVHSLERPIDVETWLFDYHICRNSTNFDQISTLFDMAIHGI